MKGEAYIFRRRSGAQNLGHLGWGFLLDPARGIYCFGSTENTSGQPRVKCGDDNGAWVATGGFTQMLQTMQTGHNAPGYDDYKSIAVEPINPGLARDTAEGKKQAGYFFTGNNCADHTVSVLEAYGVKVMPKLTPFPSPNVWFDQLHGWQHSTTLMNRQIKFPKSVQSESFSEETTEDLIQPEKTVKKSPVNRKKVKFTSDAADVVQDELDNNKLFAALMMVSLPDAFEYLGFDHKASDFDVSAPTKDEATLIRSLVKSLEAGETRISEPFVLQEVRAAAILQPPPAQYKYPRHPDVVRKVSIAALEHGLATYVKKNFRSEEFDLPARDWWTLTARGNELALNMSSASAQLAATLDCTLAFDFYLDSENYTFETDLPLELNILAAFVHDEEESEFYLSVRKGQISIANTVYPSRLIGDLVEMIAESIVPHIPISGVPVDFDFPDTQVYGEPEAKLMLSGVTVDESYVNLDFHIKANFLPGRKPSPAGAKAAIAEPDHESHSDDSFRASQNSENISERTVDEAEYNGEAGTLATDALPDDDSVMETDPSVFDGAHGNASSESVADLENHDWALANFPSGVRGQITIPVAYEMKYLNGKTSYTERFVLITCSKEYVDAAGATISAAVHQLAAEAAKIPYVGIALAAIIEVGAYWYGNANLNDDGSLTFYFAYHYCGTKTGGIDPTTTPLPGVDPKRWFSVVNNLMQVVRIISSQRR